MKTWFFPTAMVLAIFTLSCNTDPLKNAIDDFAIVVELEEINTGVGLAIYDKETGNLITQEVTVEFDEASTEHTITIFSDPLIKESFTGGVLNVGIRNESMETMEEPLLLNARVSSNGYLTQNLNIVVSDTGLVTHNIDLYHESSPPSNYISSEVSAPRDSLGNPALFSFFSPEDTAGISQNTTFNKSKGSFSTSTSAELKTIYPLIFSKSGNSTTFKVPTAQELRFVYTDGTSFTGYPNDYQITGKVWSTNAEEIESFYVQMTLPPWGTRRMSLLSAFTISELQIREQSNGSYKPVTRIEPVVAQDTLVITFISVSSGYENAQTLLTDYDTQTSGNPDVIMYSKQNFDGQPMEVKIKHYNPFELFFDASRNEALNQPVLYSTDSYTFNGIDMSKTVSFAYAYPARNSNTVSKFPFIQYRPSYMSIEPQVEVTGYDPSQAMAFGSGLATGFIRIGNTTLPFSDYMDYREAPPYEFRYFIPKTHLYIEITTPDGANPPIRYNAFNGNSNDYNRVYTFQAEPKRGGTIDTDLTINISCEDPNKAVRVSSIPQGAASIRFKESGSSGRLKEAVITSWNYTDRVLRGATVQLRRVVPNTVYDLNITFMGTTEPSQMTISGTTMSQDVVAPDNFCSD